MSATAAEIEQAVLSDDEVRALANNPKIRARVRQELEPELKAKAEGALRVYMGIYEGAVVQCGPDFHAVFTATRQRGWDHGGIGSARVDEYSQDGLVASRNVLVGLKAGTS